MKDKENVSVDEILREADEILNRISAKSNQSAADADDDGENVKIFHSEKKEKIKTFELSSKYGNTEMNEGNGKEAEKDSVSDKTRTVSMEKTQNVTVKKSESHYFKHNLKDDEYKAEPPLIIEKAATIKSKSRFDNTSDLQEIPTILAVEELDKTRIALGGEPAPSEEKNENDYDVSDQIKISGFDDVVDEIPIIDEELAEQQLRQRREDKINKFRLFAKEEVQPDRKSEARKIVPSDYNDKSDRTGTLEQLFRRKTNLQASLAITIILGLVLFLLTVFKDSQYLPPVLETSDGFYIAELVIYSIILIANFKIIIHGFNFRHGIHFDFFVSISALLTLAHTAAVTVNSDILLDGGAIYTPAAVFALFLSGIGKRSMLVRIIENFEFLTNGDDKYTVEDIVNEVDAAIISRNLLAGEPLLKYSVKTDFPTSFLEISFAYEPADRAAKVLTPVMLALNALLFGILGLLHGNWTEAFNIFTAGVIISCPVISLYASNSSLQGVSRSLAEKGAMVCGFEGAHVSHHSNALVMEASDLFGSRSCDLHGIRLFNNMKVDDALLLTAAVIIKTKSPLAHVFDDVIVGKQSILPEVDGVTYEDKMGTSAWIYQKKILVGNRDLLIHHGVSVPKEEYERKYTRKGRKALYLAVAGKISAMFVVSYSADDDLKRSLKKLEKSGITILLKSSDPYINEESMTELFELPEGFIRVLASSNARVFEKYSDTVVEKSPAYTVHNGTANAFISAILGSENLVNTENMLSVLVSFGSAIGFGVVALLGFLQGKSQLNAVNVIIFQAIWSIFVLLISKIRRSGI